MPCLYKLRSAHRLTSISRQFHSCPPVFAVPAPPSPTIVERATRKWGPSVVNPNPDKNTNLALTFGLLRYARKHSPASNITVDPLAIAETLQSSSTTYRSFLNKLHQSTPELLLPEYKIQLHDELCYNAHRLKEVISKSSTPISSYSSTEDEASSFSGYLAPRFTRAKTNFPAWFIPTCTNGKTEEQMRLNGDFILRVADAWYGETITHQIVDLEYLSSEFLMTLVMPRVTKEESINLNNSKGYRIAERKKSTIDEVLESYTVNQFLHECRHRSRMHGVVAIPTFDANYTFDSGDIRHRSSFQLSSHGLVEGGARMRRFRPHQDMSHFLLSAHRPFMWMVRHRNTNSVVLAGIVEKVNVKPMKMKYPNQKVYWLESPDRYVIQGFGKEQGNLLASE